MTRNRSLVIWASAAAAAACLPGTPTRADGALWTQIRVKDGGPAADVATISGTLRNATSIPAGADLTVRLGEHLQTIAATDLVRKRASKTLTFKAPRGAAGVRTFSLNQKTGKFTLTAGGVEVGDLAGDVAFAIDLGGRSISSVHRLTPKRGSHTWKAGEPLRARITVSVLEVAHSLGNVLLRPAASSIAFPGGAGTSQVTVTSASRTVTSRGTVSVEVEVTDQSALGEMDMGALLGSPPGFTAPGHSRVTAGDDGESLSVVFLQRSGAAPQSIPAGGGTLDTPGANGAPSGTLTVPAGAVAADVPGVRFTPLGLGALLPAPLPDAYVLVAAALLAADTDVTFDTAQAPTMTLSRPSWADVAPLSDADLRLLWWDGSSWVEQPGSGRYDGATDRVGPSQSAPARVPATGYSAWASRSRSVPAKAGAPVSRRVRGSVKDKDGVPLRNQVVLTRAGATVTGGDGSFEVPVSALSDASLEVVQAFGDGSSTSRTVTGAEAVDGPVEVVSARSKLPEFSLSIVSGTVYESGGSVPSPGASVTVAVSSANRGMQIDDGGTPANLFDDRLSVPDLSDLGVRTFEWRVRQPGSDEEFVSAVAGRSVTPIDLIFEAQAAGRGMFEGAHTVRVSYTVPVYGQIDLYAGFRLEFDDVTPRITDVQLPAAVEITSAATVVANAQGRYQMAFRAPVGVPVAATAVRADLAKTDTQPFFLQLASTRDLVFPVDADPVPPAGIPYDRWVARAPMPTARKRAASAVLDGRIWVAGGTDATGAALASLDVFDPQANSWSGRAPMSVVRDHPGMAVVGGEIWVFGGFDGTNLLASVESYDPATNQWTARPAMPVAREDVQVAELGGKVYVCGGNLSRLGGPWPRTDIFDLATGTWSPGPDMPVYPAGGAAFAFGGKLYVTGDTHALGYVPATSVYDPATTLWSQPRDSAQAYSHPAAALVNGNLVRVYGGTGYTGTMILHLVDEVVKTTLPAPTRASTFGMAEAVGGVLYQFGGTGGEYTDVDAPAIANVDALRPAWAERTAMPTARGDHGAVAVNGVIYVAGGSDATTSLATVESYDTARDLWRTRASMATAREGFALVAVDGLIYAIGGIQRPTGTHLASVECYDPASDTWTPRAPLATPRFGPAAGVIGGKIYVAGGSGKTSMEVYDPATDRWAAAKPMSGVRTQPGSAVATGRLYVFGGSDGVSSRKDGEMYDPASNQWVARAGTGGWGLERFGVATIGGRMIRSSGFDTGGEFYFPGGDFPNVAQYDVVANQWTEDFVRCPFPARGAAMVTVGDRVYWIGGISYHPALDRLAPNRGVRTYKPE